MTYKNNKIWLTPLTITIIYVMVAGLWIALSDHFLDLFVSDSEYLTLLQTYKGWFYVLITGIGLFYLIRKRDNQLADQQTKLEKAQKDWRSERELANVLFGRIPVMINIYDPDLEVFRINKELEKVIGWSNEDIQEIDFMKTCFPDLETRKEVVEFMKNPGIGWQEFTLTTRSGDEIPTSWTNVKLTDDTSVGIGIDMTEIKASQAKIRESRELLKKIFESLKSSLIVIDPKSRTIVDCNSATEEHFGYTQGELIGSSTKMLHVNDEMFKEFDKIGAEALEEKGAFKTEYQMQKKDGTIFHSDHTVTLVYDEDGQVEKVVSVIRDITEQKEYENKLKKRQERLQRSQKIGKIGDWELDPETEEIFWSPMMYEIFERNPELGPPTFQDIQSYYYQEQSQKHNRAIRNAVNEGKSYDIDLPLQTDQENKKYIRAIVIPVKDESDNVIKLRGIVQDITQRKKQEKELRERNIFIETTLEHIPIGIAINTIDEGETTLMNAKFSEIYGWPEKILADVDSFFQHIYPDEEYRKEIKQQVTKNIESGNPKQMQWKRVSITTQDGEEKKVDAKNIPLYDQNLMISTVIDVTEEEQLKEELKREKQRFELVANTTSDVIWDVNLEKDTLWWSEGYEKTFGYKPSDQPDDLRSWSDHIYPDDKEEVLQGFQNLLHSDKDYWEESYRFLKADGSIAFIIDQGLVIRNNTGKAIRMVGTMNDITERKKAEQKLLESEEKYRHIFDDNPEPMWIYNPDTLEFVEVNKAAVNHYGYSKNEFLDMTLTEIRPSEDIEKLKKDVEKHRSKKIYSGEWRHLKKDGTLIHVEITAANVQYKENTFRLALVHDITEQKRMQEKIIQSVIEGEDRERKRIAHELHDGLVQYLVAANMNFESAKKDLESLSDKRQKQFSTGLSFLKTGLQESRGIAHNLMPKAIADYGLVPALQNLINDYENSTNITFHFNHNSQNLRLKNQAEINIYRIFQELLSNAVKHGECSTIRAELQLRGDKLTMLIVDDGTGAEIQELQNNKGIGIRSVRTRINSLKGSINFESKPGAGMKITITIPNIESLSVNKEV